MLSLTRRCFQIFFIFTPNLGEDEPIFDDHIFQRGWFNHQPVKLSPQPPNVPPGTGFQLREPGDGAPGGAASSRNGAAGPGR